MLNIVFYFKLILVIIFLFLFLSPTTSLILNVKTLWKLLKLISQLNQVCFFSVFFCFVFLFCFLVLFFLQFSEWNDIQFTNSAGQKSLVRNWTNIFADKFNDIIPMRVLKFKNYLLKKPDSRKVNSPFLRLRASCKFENCCSYIYYIDEALDAVHDGVMVKFTQKEFCFLSITMERVHLVVIEPVINVV